MTAISQTSMRNKLLASLPSADFAHVEHYLEHVDLPRRTPLGTRHEQIEHVYFPTDGIASMVAVSPEGQRAEAGIFGNEGFFPTSAAMGSSVNIFDCNMQVAGEAYRMTLPQFVSLQQENRNFAKLLLRAVEAFMAQVAYTALSNAVHGVDERLARWLLMCHDRLMGNEIPLTHDFISVMLAVRRPSVTSSLHILEGNLFIRSQRGMITIRDRPAMEEFAHDAYGPPEEDYRRLMSGLFQAS